MPHVGAAPDNPQTVGQLSCQERAGQPATTDLSDSDVTLRRGSTRWNHSSFYAVVKKKRKKKDPALQ